MRSPGRTLRAALALKPNSGVTYSYLIQMQVADGSIKRRDALLKAGLQADPASSVIRRKYLFGLLPWWGGGPMPAKTADYPVQLPVALRRFVAEIERDAATTPPSFMVSSMMKIGSSEAAST